MVLGFLKNRIPIFSMSNVSQELSRIATYLPQVGRDLSANHTHSLTIKLLMAKCAKGVKANT